MKKIIKNIQDKLSSKNIISELDALSGTELNSFLLELFREKAKKISTARLLQNFEKNRFVVPAQIDTVALKQMELDWIKFARSQEFEPITLSPLAPLGTSSIVGFVHQNNVLSSLRGTEVVSDATNVLALKIAQDFKNRKDIDTLRKYVAIHRHTRGQHFENPNFSAHFSVLCLASGGLDTGNYDFEIGQLNQHLSIVYQLLSQRFGEEALTIKFYFKKGSDLLREKLLTNDAFFGSNKPCKFIEDGTNNYYKLVQFKIFVKSSGLELDMADGGLVDWTQQILSNKKQRLFISGIGTELVHKIENKTTSNR